MGVTVSFGRAMFHVNSQGQRGVEGTYVMERKRDLGEYGFGAQNLAEYVFTQSLWWASFQSVCFLQFLSTLPLGELMYVQHRDILT